MPLFPLSQSHFSTISPNRNSLDNNINCCDSHSQSYHPSFWGGEVCCGFTQLHMHTQHTNSHNNIHEIALCTTPTFTKRKSQLINILLFLVLFIIVFSYILFSLCFLFLFSLFVSSFVYFYLLTGYYFAINHTNATPNHFLFLSLFIRVFAIPQLATIFLIAKINATMF